jgi:hypothetical protein
MFQIEKNVPVPRTYLGRKSKKREGLIATMHAMDVGDSFRVEYKLASMRNFIRNSKIEGQFRAAQDGENTVRVWKVG